MAHTLASATIQDIKYEEKQDGLGVTITYKNDGTAGHETVEVSSTRRITVHIQSGTSTATQIKAAVEANVEANALVTVTIPGTAGTAQVSCANAVLASGAAAVKATKSFGGLTLTALTAGTAGNSIRFKFVTGALDVSVSTNDISITFPVGTKASAVAAAVNADAEANLLVKAEGNPNDTPRLAMASSFTALAGGAAAVAASVIVQDITVSSRATGSALNGATLSYTTGATAGSEVVAVSGTDVSLQIENGVSTATQVAAALNAAASFAGVKAHATITYGSPSNGDTLVANGTTFTKAASGDSTHFSTAAELAALIDGVTGLDATGTTTITVTASTPGTAGNALTLAKTGSALTLSSATLLGGTDLFIATVSGTGSTAQKTVNAQVTSGGVGLGGDNYYNDQSGTALTSSYVAQTWGFRSKLLRIVNDETSGSKKVNISFDGVNTAFVLAFGESLTLDYNTPKSGVYFKYVSAAPAYRVMVIG